MQPYEYLNKALDMLDGAMQKPAAKPTVSRSDERTESRVETVIKGELDAVLAAIKGELINYPPQGYGTSAQLYYDGMAGVQYVARLKRSASCD